jgi:hypothetical protein
VNGIREDGVTGKTRFVHLCVINIERNDRLYSMQQFKTREMEYDWNWFFSSFCQSAAALIGIIGAFIISRLLGLSEKINSTIADFNSLIIQYQKIKQNLTDRHFYWYTETSVRYDNEIKESICNGDYDNLTESEILGKIYDLDDTLYRIDDAVLEAINDIKDKVKSQVIENEILPGFVFKDKTLINLDIPPAGTWNELSKEKDTINQLKAEAKTLIQYFQRNLHNLNSFSGSIRPLKTIIILLMIAFPLTVIYPLHFMPMNINESPLITLNFEELFTFKSFLLTAFFLVIEAIFFYFLILAKNLKLKLNDTKSKNTDDYRNIRNYCEYFNE